MNKKGFTMVEILIAIAILAVISMVVIPSIVRYITEGKDTYNEKLENQLLVAGKNYFGDNTNLLPKKTYLDRDIEKHSYATVPEMQSKNYLDKEFIDADGNPCTESFVFVTLPPGETEENWYACLRCEGENGEEGYKTENEYCILSEDCLDNKNVIKKIELKNGQGLEINSRGYSFSKKAQNDNTKKCVFEIIYFASKKSNVFDLNVKEKRILLGELLAKDDNIQADIVVPVMNSGFWGAFGYSRERKIKLSFAIKNNKNILRTFIEKPKTRLNMVDDKYSIIDYKVKNKNVVVVDDSIVRGHTVKKISSLLKSAGAKSVHFRLFSPPVVNVCHWGVDILDRDELLAYKYKSKDNEIIEKLGVDSIKYISDELFYSVFDKNYWCSNCFKMN